MRLYRYFAVLLLVIGCAPQAGLPERSSRGTDHLALHWESAGSPNDVRWYHLVGSDERIAVEPEPVLALHHFSAARIAQEPSGRHFVELVMTAEGRSRLKEQSSAIADRRRLAIVFEAEIMALPMVTRTIDAEALNLPIMPDAQAAEELARRMDSAIKRM
jgi:hypothetical protein